MAMPALPVVLQGQTPRTRTREKEPLITCNTPCSHAGLHLRFNLRGGETELALSEGVTTFLQIGRGDELQYIESNRLKHLQSPSLFTFNLAFWLQIIKNISNELPNAVLRLADSNSLCPASTLAFINWNSPVLSVVNKPL